MTKSSLHFINCFQYSFTGEEPNEDTNISPQYSESFWCRFFSSTTKQHTSHNQWQTDAKFAEVLLKYSNSVPEISGTKNSVANTEQNEQCVFLMRK